MAGRRSTVRRKRPFTLALIVASGLHVLLGVGLLAGIKVMPPLVEQTLIVDLVDVAPPAPRVEAPAAPVPTPSSPKASPARAVAPPPPPPAQVATAPAPSPAPA
ncbi:hypothetical protein DDF62_07400, partial [Caulobacter radicis]